MYDDKFAGNDFYAEVGCLDLQELNTLESVFLRKLSWDLLIPEQSMVLIRSQLLNLEYNTETHDYSFRKREIGKKTC